MGNKIGFDLEDTVFPRKKHIISWRRRNKAKQKKSSKRVDTAGIVKLAECFFIFILFIYTYDEGVAGERKERKRLLPIAFEINVLFSKGNESIPLHFFFFWFFFRCLFVLVCIFEKKLQRDGKLDRTALPLCYFPLTLLPPFLPFPFSSSAFYVF